MNKNILFLKNLLDNNKNTEIDNEILKDFLYIYIKKNHIYDVDFLNGIDLFDYDRDLLNLTYSFDYKKYVDFEILDNSAIFISLNDKFYYINQFDSLKDNLYILNFLDLNILKLFNSFNDKFISDNLNFFYILNILFYKYVLCISIPSFFTYDNIYVLRFYDNNHNNNIYFPRTFINVQNNLNLNIIEGYFNLSKNKFINSNSYLLLNDESSINYTYINKSEFNNFNCHSFYSKLLNKSNLFFKNYFFGNNNSKSNYNFFLLGKDSILKTDFSRYLRNKTTDTIGLKTFHLGLNSFSRVNFRSIVDDFSSSIFNGLIDVDFNVLNIDAGLTCKSLLLDKNSQVDLNPDLSIKNNDIKCFHAATIGFLDENIIFYLISRGLSNNEAISLLINAFFYDLINENDPLFKNFLHFLFKEYYIY